MLRRRRDSVKVTKEKMNRNSENVPQLENVNEQIEKMVQSSFSNTIEASHE